MIRDLNRQLNLELRETLSDDALEDLLAEQVDYMIHRDFQSLVQFLYRIDVSETRLKKLLEEATGENAGRIIARLILERQRQKVETRRQYRQTPKPGGRDGGPEDPDLERL